MLFDETRDISMILGYFMKLIPPLMISTGILDITNAKLYATLWNESADEVDLWEWKHCGKNIFYLFFNMILYLSLLILLEYVS